MTPILTVGNRQVRAVDGDTICVGGDRIRLCGIDTPELSEIRRSSSQALTGGVAAQRPDSHRAVWPGYLQSSPGQGVRERAKWGGDVDPRGIRKAAVIETLIPLR